MGRHPHEGSTVTAVVRSVGTNFADLLELSIELTITTGGNFGLSLSAAVDGLDDFSYPIELLDRG